MNKIAMKLAQRMIDKVVDTVSKDGGEPVCACVCDEEGILVAFIRMDGTAAKIVHNAQMKAYTAARMQARTADFLERIKRENITLNYFCDPKLMPFPGGAPLVDKTGNIIGAIGVSGRVSEEDQKLADMCAQMVHA